MSRRPPKKALAERGSAASAGYDSVLTEVVRLLEDSRRASVRAVNTVMTATCREVGQREAKRAGYGKELLKRLSLDLIARFGRGFSQRNLQQMRLWRIRHRLRNLTRRSFSQVVMIFRARWAEDIHEEWIRSVFEVRTDLRREQFERTRELMNANVRDCHVLCYLWVSPTSFQCSAEA